MSHSQGSESFTAVFLVFYTGAATFSFKQHLNYTQEAERIPFQTHYFSENLVHHVDTAKF
jgi:hypothetical protein